MNKHVICRSLFILLVVLSAITISVTFPVAKEKKVIRVAYPLQQGLTLKDEEGNHYGYDYDYLMQIAQHTGWEYEFVEVEGTLNERLVTLMTMLQNGEIDIMGGMRYNEKLAEMYDYPSEAYGNAYNILATHDSSDIVDLTTLINKKNLRIAVLESSSQRIEKLDQFASMNGLQFEKVFCASEGELLSAIENGDADAILVVDLSIPENFHSVAKFSPDSFYLATTKGNTEVIKELNQAMDKINQTNPTLISTLYNRYFASAGDTLILSNSEQMYLQDHPTINVLIRDFVAPIQYLDEGNPAGIGKDILDYIQTKTDVNFEYIIATSIDDYKQQIQSGKIDLVMGLPYETNTANILDINLSNPYVNSSLLLVVNNDVDPNDLLSYNQAMSNYSTQIYDNNSNLAYYESPSDILEAINDGSADYAYLNNYLAMYYINKYQLRNIATFPTADYLQSQYAFGIADSENFTLLSIMNKAIRACDKDLNTYIYKNGYVVPTFQLREFVIEHLASIMVSLVLLVAVVIIFLRRYYRHQLGMKKAVELEYRRYLMLSEISGEMTFSYDYRNDQLKISSSGINRLAEKSLLDHFSSLAENGQGSIEKTIYHYLMLKKDINEEANLCLLNNEMKWYQLTIKVVKDVIKNTEQVIYAIGRVQDIHKEKEERELLRHKSQTDILTGLWNRAGAEELITNEIQRSTTTDALLMLDLDNFKDVNDTYGHFEGDRVLLETAVLLTEVFSNSIVARLGGDEFVIYKTEVSEASIGILCEQLLSRINNLPCMQERKTYLSLSIGVVITNHRYSLEALLKHADRKLYDVKRDGRNGYQIYIDLDEHTL